MNSKNARLHLKLVYWLSEGYLRVQSDVETDQIESSPVREKGKSNLNRSQAEQEQNRNRARTEQTKNKHKTGEATNFLSLGQELVGNKLMLVVSATSIKCLLAPSIPNIIRHCECRSMAQPILNTGRIPAIRK